jgi:hypothetical protein
MVYCVLGVFFECGRFFVYEIEVMIRCQWLWVMWKEYYGNVKDGMQSSTHQCFASRFRIPVEKVSTVESSRVQRKHIRDFCTGNKNEDFVISRKRSSCNLSDTFKNSRVRVFSVPFSDTFFDTKYHPQSWITLLSTIAWDCTIKKQYRRRKSDPMFAGCLY